MKPRLVGDEVAAKIVAKAEDKPPPQAKSEQPVSEAAKSNRARTRNAYIDSDDEDDGVFKNFTSKKKSPDASPEPKINIYKRKKMSPSVAEVAEETDTKIPIESWEAVDAVNQMIDDGNSIDLMVPKIYFGTRTHKQLGQVVKELKRTVYASNVRMSILSSREHTCIRELLPAYKNKTEMCRDLLDKKKRVTDKFGRTCSGCPNFDGKQKLITSKIAKAVWDIEDFVKTGRDLKSCPYFAARDLAASAHIVFCPYNYILDPLIRSSTSIEVENSVILLDEAHNIEDVCRESGSLQLEMSSIIDSIEEIDTLLKTRQEYVNHTFSDLYALRKYMTNWKDWFENHTPLIQKKSEMDMSLTLTGVELSRSLTSHDIGFENFPSFIKMSSDIMMALREKKETSEDEANSKATISSAIGVLIESLWTTLNYFFRNKCENLSDYFGILIKKEEWVKKPQNKDGWLTKSSQKKSKEYTLTLNMKCMNPAIVFGEVEKKARCVILTSGTLTPNISFPAELGAEFPIVVHTNHVISAEQVWVASVNVGPNNVRMEATYQNTGSPEWQDSLGQLLLWICENVPNGVLCFLSSYRLIEMLYRRWEYSGVMENLTRTKNVFFESKNMKEHDEIMSEYYTCSEDVTGALLLAVFRGKVSEGMDFRDHQARAVVTVGIPYPNVRDSLICNKMKYNEAFKAERGLLSGNDWLQVQAYRALNQALGRCVRHRNDWGAVIMVDSRFQNQAYTKHVSKWIRNFLADNHLTWDSLRNGPRNLKLFMDKMSAKC